jgi:hypothetical protein
MVVSTLIAIPFLIQPIAGVSLTTLHGNVIDPNERRKTSWRREKEETFLAGAAASSVIAGQAGFVGVQRRCVAISKLLKKASSPEAIKRVVERQSLFVSGKIFLAPQSEQCFASLSAGVFTRSIL